MIGLLRFVLGILASLFKSKSRLKAENAVLRHQLIVLRDPARQQTRDEHHHQRHDTAWREHKAGPCRCVAETPLHQLRQKLRSRQEDDPNWRVAIILRSTTGFRRLASQGIKSSNASAEMHVQVMMKFDPNQSSCCPRSNMNSRAPRKVAARIKPPQSKRTLRYRRPLDLTVLRRWLSQAVLPASAVTQTSHEGRWD